MRLITLIFLSVALFSVQIPALYAAQQRTVKLTTYYPAPYGEYKELRAEKLTVGPLAQSQPVTAGNIVLAPQTGANDPANTTPPSGREGELAYSSSKDALYGFNGSTWVSQGGGGGITSITIWGQGTCPVVAGFTATLVLTGFGTTYKSFASEGGAGLVCSNFIYADGTSWLNQNTWRFAQNEKKYGIKDERLACAECIYAKT